MNQQILAEKKEKVSAIDKVLKTSQTVVVVSFSGISVDEVNQLRIDLKKNNAKMVLHKNSLLKKALDGENSTQLDKFLKGPNGIVTSDKDGGGLEVLKEFAAAHSKQFSIKAGLLGGTFCDETMINEFASIGSKENAISILLSTLESPLIQLGLTLKALGEKVGKDAPAAAAAPSAN